MSWMPRDHSVYPCRARPNVICPMRVHSPYIVKSIEMVPSCLIFPLQFECSKISSTSTFNQKRKPSTFNHALYAEVLHVCNSRTSSSISFSQRLILSCSPDFLQTYSVLNDFLSLSLSLQPYQFQVSNNYMNHSEFIFIGGINYSHIPLYNFLIFGDYNN